VGRGCGGGEGQEAYPRCHRDGGSSPARVRCYVCAAGRDLVIEVQSFLDTSKFVVGNTMDQALDRIYLGAGAEANGLTNLDAQLAVSHLEDVLDVVLLTAGGDRVAVVVAEDGLLIWCKAEASSIGWPIMLSQSLIRSSWTS